MKCNNCKNEEFEKQDGLFFCKECGVQLERNFEMEFADFENPTIRKRKLNIKTADSESSRQRAKALKGKKLTSWEEYNYILIGLVNEILEIWKIPNFKKTVLQIWITYLQQTEAAFFSKKSFEGPKLLANYRDEDAHIIYNKKLPAKKKRVREYIRKKVEDCKTIKEKRLFVKRSVRNITKQLSESMKSESMNSSSFLSSLSIDDIIAEHEEEELDIEFTKSAKNLKRKRKLDENDQAKVIIRKFTQSERAKVLNSKTLFVIISCALNICKSEVQIADLIRFSNEGKLSFHRMAKLLPEDYIELGIKFTYPNQKLHEFNVITDKAIRTRLINFINFIPDIKHSLVMPDLISLVRKYCEDLNLPKDIAYFAENLIKFHPPQMKINRVSYPNYEGRAIAYILFIMKLIFGIDNCREVEMSDSADNFENLTSRKIFNFIKWKEYIEYRKRILEKFYPTSILNCDYDGTDPHEAYNALYESLQPTSHKSQVKDSSKKKLTAAKDSLIQLTNKLITAHNETNHQEQLHKKYSFPISLTPQKDNFKIIIDHEKEFFINQELAEMNFSNHSLEYYLRPELLEDEMYEKEIKVKVKKSKFPDVFTIEKPSKDKKVSRRGFYNLELIMKDKKAEKAWKEDFKKMLNDDEKDEAEKLKEKNYFHEQQVFRLRKSKRKTIKKKLQDESIDISYDEIIPNHINDNHDDHENDESLLFITPDYNMWRYKFEYMDSTLSRKDEELEMLPESFQWLLQTVSNIIHQFPVSVYYQLMCIEFQYMFILEPIEIMKNVVLTRRGHHRRISCENNCKNFTELW